MPRLLVIGDDEVFLQIAAQSDEPPVRADNHFEALGEVAMRSGSDRITAVLIDETVLDPECNAVHALRAIDPTIDLIALHRVSGNGAQQPVPAELFDARIDVPLATDALQHALAAVATPTRRESATPDNQSSTPEPPTESAPAAPAASAISTERRVESDSIDAPTDPSPSAEPPRDVEDDSLGDVDLIDALLADPRGLRERALTIVRQYADLPGLTLEQRQPAICCAEVCAAGTTFGWLAAHNADPADLESWADWLSRWLSLERQFRTYRRLAYRDDLTGAWNRRFFFRFLDETLREAQKKRRPVTLMIFDIDDFKLYNDQFGHHAGDEVLIETVRLLQSVIRTGDRVCRIGGDEFAVIFADLEGPREVGSAHPETVEQIARRFQDQVCRMRFPKLGEQAPGPLSISGGLATYPWDGADANTLLRHADQLALESKRKGKNVITFGPGVQRTC